MISKTDKMMKKPYIFLAAAMLLSACYPDYVLDYDGGTAVYTAYQYDLRTFVLGEDESFDFTVALGGVEENRKDRAVDVRIDDALLSADLSTLAPDGAYGSFTALDAFLGNGRFGTVCQKYVTDEVRATGISSLEALPSTHYTVSGLNGLQIRSGRHTAAVTVRAADLMKADPRAFAPYYAIAFRIASADADRVPPERSFEVIAVKCENRFFGQWSCSGSTTVSDASGNVLDTEEYEASLSDDQVYNLTTVDGVTVRCDKLGNLPGGLLLTLSGDNTLSLTPEDPSVQIEPVPGEPSFFNGAALLQDRELHLNYRYTEYGITYTVRDVLHFRSRVRDGVLEWQDEHPENYNK